MRVRFTPGRITAAFAALVALLIGWRFWNPHGTSLVLDGIGRDALELWTSPYLHIGEVGVTPALLVKLVVFLTALVFATKLLRATLTKRLLSRLPIEEGQRFVIERLFSYTVFAFGFIVVLQSAGLHLDSLLAVGAAVGIGIGLGLQTIAKNFASGLVLLLERPIKVGDRVAVGDLLGDVIRIGGRSTWVRTNENVVIIVPNAEFIENRVINWTAADRFVRISVPLGVSYGSDPDEVRAILLEVARRHPDVSERPASDVIFTGFGDSSLNFELRIWTAKQVQTPKIIASDLYFEIFRAFRAGGVEIPFPQRDLHLKSVSAAAEATLRNPGSSEA